MIKFQVNKTYQAKFIGDSNLKIELTIKKRTAKTVTDTNGKTYRIKTDELDKTEYFYPEGRYAKCPIMRASKLATKGDGEDIEKLFETTFLSRVPAIMKDEGKSFGDALEIAYKREYDFLTELEDGTTDRSQKARDEIRRIVHNGFNA